MLQKPFQIFLVKCCLSDILYSTWVQFLCGEELTHCSVIPINLLSTKMVSGIYSPTLIKKSLISFPSIDLWGQTIPLFLFCDREMPIENSRLRDDILGMNYRWLVFEEIDKHLNLCWWKVKISLKVNRLETYLGSARYKLAYGWLVSLQMRGLIYN